MPQPGNGKLEESLFSLELVVEKLYIPHIQCRFPAVVFRLLDYPTIVIKHVDDELGKAIRSKISFDPYYQLPDQFIELRDRHGNFMVNKGKSCLFRIPADILKQHLANTPLYVMVIDLFPEVPKLVGNSSVPLNTSMDSICIDIAKLGSTVPSVHGDKGLFKLYNLMGKEIGYFVLGFRLLCLGPSLIPHLPESILLHQQSKSRQISKNQNQSTDRVIENYLAETNEEDGLEVELRNSACMTDPIKHDVLLQTVEMQDKATHVGLLDSGVQTELDVVSKKGSHSLSTQTEKRTRKKEAQNAQQKWVNFIKPQADEYEDIIINNIVCPPPLFYNSNASPSIKIERKQFQHELSIDDLSDIQSYDGQGLEKVKTRGDENIQQGKSFVSPKIPVPQARVGETVMGLQVAPNPGTVFPLLTALLNELACIQSPQLLLKVSSQIQAASLDMQQSGQSPAKIEQTHHMQKIDKLSPSTVHAVAAALTKKIENAPENPNMDRYEKPSKSQNSQPSTVLNTAKQKIQRSQKQTSVRPLKKTKLVYGITNTQRLRLQKANPQWLKAAEKDMPNLKMKIQQPKKETEIDQPSAALFSDTLTEVRRLAEKELNKTTSEDTLVELTRTGRFSPRFYAEHNEMAIPEVKDRNTKISTRKAKEVEKNKRTVGGESLCKTSVLIGGQKSNRNKASHQYEALKGIPDSGELARVKPVPQVRQFRRNIASPPYDDQEFNAEDKNDQASPDRESSKSHSVEVSLPSPDDSTDSIPLPDDSLADKGESLSINFPKYLSKDISLPESIDGTANVSLNLSDALDDNSPLESTRQSKNIASDQNESKVLHSTDYDTRQFQSTDEPELQDLLSEEENPSNDAVNRHVVPARGTHPFPVINPQLSENSPVPSVRRSTNKQDFTMHSYIPSFSQKLESSSSSRSSNNKSYVQAATDVDVKAHYGPKDNKIQQHDLSIKKFPVSDRNNTPSSTNSSPRRPTPQPRKPTPRSLHTDSLSSYMPSDPDNVVISLSSQSGTYSDDFLLYEAGGNKQPTSSVEPFQRIIPNSKLGYTIH